jgi:Flp pilus assembly protein TadD
MEHAARLNPSNLENMDNLATAYLQLGRPGDAKRVLQAVMAQNERHAPAHNLLGLLEIQGGRGPEARSHFEKAIEYNPDLAEPYMNLGLLAQNAGETKFAIVYYKRFLKAADPEKHREVIPKVKAALADLENEK